MLLVLIKLRRLVYEGSAYSPETPPSTNWAPTRDRQTTPKMASRTAYTSQVPVLPVELSGDFMWALTRVSKTFGGRLMSQEALKVYQALPLA